MYILYLQNYENKMRSFCVEIVQTGVHCLIAFSVLMFPLSPLALPIDTKVCFQNIMQIRPDSLCFLSARAFFFDLWTKFVFCQSPLLAYQLPGKGFFLLSKYTVKSAFSMVFCFRLTTKCYLCFLLSCYMTKESTSASATPLKV